MTTLSQLSYSQYVLLGGIFAGSAILTSRYCHYLNKLQEREELLEILMHNNTDSPLADQHKIIASEAINSIPDE